MTYNMCKIISLTTSKPSSENFSSDPLAGISDSDNKKMYAYCQTLPETWNRQIAKAFCVSLPKDFGNLARQFVENLPEVPFSLSLYITRSMPAYSLTLAEAIYNRCKEDTISIYNTEIEEQLSIELSLVFEKSLQKTAIIQAIVSVVLESFS